MKHFVVAIGREFGSGGKHIGMMLAESLGVRCYDDELVSLAEDELDMDREDVEALDERLRFNVPSYMDMGINRRTVEVFEAQQNAILKIADKESCVFIGRCADYILRNRDDLVSVFVYAPYGVRFARLKAEYPGASDDYIHKMIEEVEYKRHNYHKYFTKKRRSSKDYRHVMIDSSLLGYKGTARMLEGIIREKFED